MPKIDFKKEFKELYSASKDKPIILEVPEINYLMIDGQGDPNTSLEYKQAIEALFPVSFKVKFISKKEKSQDYVVMPLEGIWWAENMENFNVDDKSNWKWTAMIMQPDFITKTIIKKAMKEVESQKNLPSLSKMRFESYKEGLCAQILHIGPYSKEKQTVSILHDFIVKEGYEFNGEKHGERHHEIYLSDVRRSKPENLKTIIRQPLK
jgi:hypothetical protein